jgi:DNA processing protein
MVDRVIIHPLKGKMSSQELSEEEALMILSSFPSLGIAKLRTLVHYFGSGLHALLAEPKEISTVPSFGNRMSAHWENWPNEALWKQNIAAVAKYGVAVVPYNSPKYPKRLLEIPDAPVVLYIKGEMTAADHRSLAIVGTRQASIYGQEMAQRFAYELAGLGFTIVSGLARGIDTAAHYGALERGRTIAVIGSGLGDIYPAENLRLADRISTKGAVISEFPMLTPPDRSNFPQRNRIVSGMTLGTLLIEAPIKSGAMITMEKAESYERPLFALPGRIDSDNFRGNHALIKQGRALLVENAAEVANHYDQLFGVMPSVAPTINMSGAPGLALGSEEEALWTSLPSEELSVEQILLLAKVPISALNVLLMKLVLKGRLKEFPGKVYKKIGAAR